MLATIMINKIIAFIDDELLRKPPYVQAEILSELEDIVNALDDYLVTKHMAGREPCL